MAVPTLRQALFCGIRVVHSPGAREMSDVHSWNISVLGAGGMLGTELTARLRASQWQVRAFDLPEWDIRRQSDIERAVADADVVINCAAFTDVDRAERARDTAEAINATAVRELARNAARAGCHMIHISTDFVFDGMSSTVPYDETATPNPLSVYGRTKLEGETAVRQEADSWTILRIQWTYGIAGNNFVRKLVQRASSGTDVRMVSDQRGAPTWTRNVADVIRALAENGAQGVFHYAARGCNTRFEIAEFILSELGVPCTLVPCRTSDFPNAAPRPLNSCFDCTRLDEILPLPRPHWTEALGTFLAQNRAELLSIR